MLVVVRVRGCDVDDVYIRVGDEVAVGAVGHGGGRGANFFEKSFGAGKGSGRCGGDDLMAEVLGIASMRVDQEVTGEFYLSGLVLELRFEREVIVGSCTFGNSSCCCFECQLTSISSGWLD
jgi:hypothetical protein